MKKINIKIPGWAILIAAIILTIGLAATFTRASGRFNLPLSWILTPSGTSIDTDNDGIVDTERLPFEQGDITSDVDSNSWDLGYYDVANLTQGNVKLDETFGRNETGTLAPDGTAAAGDVCDSETFYSGDSWTQKTGTRVDSDCGYITSGWSGVCIYKTGDVECPAEYPNKHTRVVCSSYGCTLNSVRFYVYNTADCSGHIGSNTWTGSSCTNIMSTGVSMKRENYDATGSCSGSTTYTYCCE